MNMEELGETLGGVRRDCGRSYDILWEELGETQWEELGETVGGIRRDWEEFGETPWEEFGDWEEFGVTVGGA